MAPSAAFANPLVAMFTQIVTHTPVWVWGVFALLAWLGGRQLRASVLGLRRVVALPLAMTALSVLGTVSAFGGQLTVLLAWALVAGACAAAVLATKLPQGTRFDRHSRSFHVPGSAVPLVLMLGIFTTKYAVGVTTAMHPLLAQSSSFALPCAALLGAFSGVFAARTVRLLRLMNNSSAGHTTALPVVAGATAAAR